MNVLVIGQGAVGRALVAGFKARGIPVEGISARRSWIPYDHDAVIYAAGPAGETACRKDPYVAFTQHYSEAVGVAEWVSETPGARLVMIGTVFPPIGFYGALKQLALDHAREAVLESKASGAVLALRCGQIIGPEMPVDGTGVVATWVRQAVADQPLTISHSLKSTVEVTICADLLHRIMTWLMTPVTIAWEEERVCFPDPILLTDLAAICRDLGKGRPIAVVRDLAIALRGMTENAAAALRPVGERG